MKQKYEIVLRYLSQREGEHTVKLKIGTFGMYKSKLHQILYVQENTFNDIEDYEKWCVSDLSLNAFITQCELLSSEECATMVFSSGLQKIKEEIKQ